MANVSQSPGDGGRQKRQTQQHQVHRECEDNICEPDALAVGQPGDVRVLLAISYTDIHFAFFLR